MRIIILMVLFLYLQVMADWSWPDCDDITPENFKEEVLVSILTNHPDLKEPLGMDYNMHSPDNVDVYFVERLGKIKVYKASTGQVETLGELEVFTDQYKGLIDIALDPEFKINRWIYLFYFPLSVSTSRVSRFTISGSGNIDPASEKILVDIPNIRERASNYHTGGAMEFDDYDDLWITFGDNVNVTTENQWNYMECELTSTKSFTGGIIRIHPDTSAPNGYTIPKGNMGEYYAEIAQENNDVARAAELRDPDIVSPEIYAKGMRNPFALTLDPVRRWAAYGDCGPDWGGITEEQTVATRPGFYGSPYFFGNNVSHPDRIIDAQAPTRPGSCTDGLETLPPAIPATYSYEKRCAMTGPIYRYDGDLESEVKFPPHFNRYWFLADFNSPSWVKAARLDSQGQEILDIQDIFTNIGFSKLVALEQGPDGALYVNNYGGWLNTSLNTRISRIIYTGTECNPTHPKLEKTGCATENPEINPLYHDPEKCGLSAKEIVVSIPVNQVVFDGLKIIIQETGKHTIQITNVMGKQEFSIDGEGIKEYSLKRIEQPGIYFVHVKTGSSSVTRRFFKH